MSKVVFFEADTAAQNVSLVSINIGIGLQNVNLENWLIQELEKREIQINRKVLIPQDENLGNLDVLVILRKNRSGGIDQPVGVIRQFIQANPHGYVLFIAGTLDDRGKEMVTELKSFVPRLYVASVPSGVMGPEVVEQSLSDLITQWSKSKSKTYLLLGAKGGCGVTTIIAHLANELAKKSKVIVIENRESLKYHTFSSEVQLFQRNAISYEEIADLQEKCDYLLLDDVSVPYDVLHKKILVIDGSPESIDRAKNMESDILVVNHACESALPIAVIENELGKSIQMILKYDRETYIRASITGDSVIDEIQKLINF